MSWFLTLFTFLTANGGNPLYGRQMSFLASVMEILQMKGQKGKKSNKTTLQTGMTEKEFSEGGEKLYHQ